MLGKDPSSHPCPPRTPDPPVSIFLELGLHVYVTMLALHGASAGDSTWGVAQARPALLPTELHLQLANK